MDVSQPWRRTKGVYLVLRDCSEWGGWKGDRRGTETASELCEIFAAVEDGCWSVSQQTDETAGGEAGDDSLRLEALSVRSSREWTEIGKGRYRRLPATAVAKTWILRKSSCFLSVRPSLVFPSRRCNGGIWIQHDRDTDSSSKVEAKDGSG